MKRWFLILCLVMGYLNAIYSQQVSRSKAKEVAETFFNQNVRNDKGATPIQFTDVTPNTDFENFYIFSSDSSFVIVAGDERETPILAFSDKNPLVTENMPDNLHWWLEGYDIEIKYLIENNETPSTEVISAWSALRNGQPLSTRGNRFVSNLLSTEWDQFNRYVGCDIDLYNNYCPFDNNANKRTVTGCTATAMAQIMKYWNFPAHGFGYHDYVPQRHPEYGTQYANFGDTYYDWQNMPNKLNCSSSPTQIDAVAELMRHCGISVDMDYGYLDEGGSGAPADKALKAFSEYFNYYLGAELIYAHSYTENDFHDLILNELEAGHPVFMSGKGNEGGHAFVCDGKHLILDQFHFNWGYSGKDDGYFTIGSNFPYNISAIIGLHPNNPNLAIPGQLRVAESNAGQLQLSWNMAQGASCYQLFRNGELIASNISNTNYVDSDFPYGPLRYQVISVAADGSTSYSSNTAYYLNPYHTPIPLELESSTTSNTVSLAWIAPENEGKVFQHHPLNFYESQVHHLENSLDTCEWVEVFPDEEVVQYGSLFIYSIEVWVSENAIGKPHRIRLYNEHYEGNEIILSKQDFTFTTNVAGWHTHYLPTPIRVGCGEVDVFIKVDTPDNVADYIETTDSDINSYVYKYYIKSNGKVEYYYKNISPGNHFLINFHARMATEYTYNIYRDGVRIASGVEYPSFVDPYVPNGSHTYYITTNYYGGESEPSNTVQVDVAISYPITCMTNLVGGSISAQARAYPGTAIDVNVTTAQQYHLNSLYYYTYNPNNTTDITSSMSFIMPESPVTIGAVFEENQSGNVQHTVHVLTGIANGSIGSVSPNRAREGTMIHVNNVQPNYGYGISTLYYYTAHDPIHHSIDLLTRQFVMPNDDVTVGATFSNTNFTVSASCSPTGTGSLLINGGTTNPITATVGQEVVMTAISHYGYVFDSWRSAVDNSEISRENPYTFSVLGNTNLVAVFRSSAANYYSVNTTAVPSVGGSVTPSGTYPPNTYITVSATANSGYHFEYWQKNGSSTPVSYNQDYSFSVTENVNLSAVFSNGRYQITASATQGGYVEGGGEYAYGEWCNLQAFAYPHYSFSGWKKNGATYSGGSNIGFTVQSSAAFQAQFTGEPCYIAISCGEGGTVSESSGNRPYGSNVTLHAHPATGYYFVGWKEDGYFVSTSTNYSFYVTGPRSLYAVFAPYHYSISVVANHNSYGYVTGGTSDITHGSQHVITAYPHEGYLFGQWTNSSGETVSYSPTYAFSVTGNETYAAVFKTMSEANPVYIYDRDDLEEFRDHINSGTAFVMNGVSVNAGGLGKSFILMDDIDLDEDVWVPIGNYESKPFKGNFVGNGHVVKNFTVNQFGYAGLFGVVTGRISKLGVVASGIVSTNYSAGGICGWLKGTDENGNETNASIFCCFNTSAVVATSDERNAGGICGFNYKGAISDCYNTGATRAEDGGSGGICGKVDQGYIAYCYNVGSHVGTHAGAICGIDVGGNGMFYECAYDKQMSTVGGIDGTDYGVMALLTDEMDYHDSYSVLWEGMRIGWTYPAQSYPRLGCFAEYAEEYSEASTATLYFYHHDEYGAMQYEYADMITSDFTVSNDYVTWRCTGSSCGSVIDIDGENVELLDEGDAILIAKTSDGSICRSVLIQVNPVMYDVDLDYSGNGYVDGEGTYVRGHSVTISAHPSTGWHFDKWIDGSGNIISTNRVFTFEVVCNKYLEAVFEKDQYAVVLEQNISEAGSVTGDGIYDYNDWVTVYAHPNYQYSFENWTENGETVSASQNYSFNIRANRNLRANFSPNSYVLNLSQTGNGSGTVYGGGNYSYGTVATVIADANMGSSFEGWFKDGELCSTDAYYSFTVTCSVTLIAHFSQESYAVTTMASPSEAGNTEGDGTYHYGDVCTITAIPNEGYHFDHWSQGVDVTIGADNSSSYNYPFNCLWMDSWQESIYTSDEIGESGLLTKISYFSTSAKTLDCTSLKVYLGETTRSSISSNVDWSPEEDLTLVYLGANITLGGAEGWYDIVLDTPFDYDGTKNLVVIVAKASNTYNYSCQFQYSTYTDNKTLYRQNDDNASYAEYPNGASGTLTADRANVRFEFYETISDEPNYSFTVTGDDTFYALFSPNSYGIAAMAEPAAYGNVSGMGFYEYGSVATLSAEPYPGYGFINWTENGEVVSTDQEYSFTVTGDHNLTAHFYWIDYSITAFAVPPQNGEVEGGGIFHYGDGCTLTATPDEGCHFVNWTKGIGDVVVGVKENINTYFPSYERYCHSLTQQIYTAQEIGPAGTIDKISFQYAGEPNGSLERDIAVYLKHTSKDSFDNDTDWEAVTENDMAYSGIWRPDAAIVAENSFRENFDNGIPSEWTMIDADGDGYNWRVATELLSSNSGHNGSTNFVLSQSFDFGYGILYPDNYLVTPLVAFTVGSTFSFWACAQDANWAAEHFGVAVSLAGNTNASDFTTIQEWTVSTRSTDHGDGRGGTRDQSAWRQYTVDLSAYAGQIGYIAIRHFGCSDMFYLDVDDCELSAGSHGTYPQEMSSWNTIILDEPFEYDGVHNLLVCFDDNTGSWAPDRVFYSYETAERQSISAWADVTDFNPSTPYLYTGSRYTNKNHIKLGFGRQEVASDLPDFSFVVTEDASYYAHFEVDEYLIEAIPSPDDAGMVTGTGNHFYGTSCALSATPNEGYHFVNWIENSIVASTEPTYSFTVTEPRSLVANFALNEYDIQVYVNSLEGGSVEGYGHYQYGATATLTATPFTGYTFVNWTENGIVVSANPSYVFTVTSDRTLTANFQANSYTVSAAANPSAGGVVSGAGTYYYGQDCLLSVVANTGYTFVNWTENGEVVSTETSIAFTIDGDRNLTANFVINSYSVELDANPPTMGAVYGDGTYLFGEAVTVSAIANTGFSFVNWTENGIEISSEPEFSFTVEGDVRLTAHFEISSYVINTDASPVEGGTVSGGGIYTHGTEVTVTAIPNEHYDFVNWTENGIVLSTSPSYLFVAESDRNLTANYTLAKHTVSATIVPETGGVVWGCHEYEYGQTAMLTASPNIGFVFLNWMENGETLSTESTISFTVEGDRNLVANFMESQGSVLNEGWNWWSTYIEQNGAEGLTLLEESLCDDAEMIKSQSDGFVMNIGDSWQGSLTSISNEQMYLIKTLSPCAVNLPGSVVRPQDLTITLNAGWNWIGYPVAASEEVNEALSGFQATNGDMLKAQQNFSTYFEGFGWFGSLNVLQPGMGLMYHSENAEPVHLTYHAATRDADALLNIVATDNKWVPDVYRFANNMSYIAVVDLNGEELSAAHYELAAFSHGECRGSARLMYSEALARHVAFLTVYGEDGDELTFHLCDLANGDVYYASATENFAVDGLRGTAQQPYPIHFSTLGMDENIMVTLHIYPNPVERGHAFHLDLPGCDVLHDEVKVEVISALGVTIYSNTFAETPVTLPGIKVPAAYFVKVVAGPNKVYYGKLIVE